MSNTINIAVNSNDAYKRYLTGQDGIPDLTPADTVTKVSFTVPADIPTGKTAKIQWAEAPGYATKNRWYQISGKDGDIPRPVMQAVSGTWNFECNSVKPGTNAVAVAPGEHVIVTVWQQDPNAPPKHGASFDEVRNMLFDWSAFV